MKLRSTIKCTIYVLIFTDWNSSNVFSADWFSSILMFPFNDCVVVVCSVSIFFITLTSSITLIRKFTVYELLLLSQLITSHSDNCPLVCTY